MKEVPVLECNCLELTEVPVGAKSRLVEFSPLGEVFQEGNWVNFVKLGSEWAM
jgi:hypothetical protein